LGRNYRDVCDAIQGFMRGDVIMRAMINNLAFDGATKDPMQPAVRIRDALIRFMSAMAQAQAEPTKEARREPPATATGAANPVPPDSSSGR
jgi:putative DNA-invertase from lambdoid prophage Rac